VRELTCEVSGVRPGGAAWRAGLRTGDEITAIGALKDPIFSDLQKGVTLGDVSKGVEFTIRRPADGSTRTLLLRPDTDLGVPTVGVTSPFSLTLPADLKEGLPGAAGRATPALEAGDTIRAIDGVAVETYAQLVAELAHRIDKPVRLTVSRGGHSGGAATTVEIELPPQPMRTMGMVMTPLAVKAVQDDSPASRAGIRPGDRIVAVDGVAIGDPLTLDERLQSRVGDTVKITVTRADGATEDIDIVPRAVEWLEEARWPTSPVSISALGVAIGVDAIVAAVVPDSAAAAAGIVAGDRVVRVRFVRPGEDATRDEGLELSEKSPSWPYVKGALQQVEEGTTLALEVEGADGSRRDVSLTAVVDPARFVVDRGLLFEPVYKMVRAGSIPAALRLGFRKAIDDLSLVYKFLHKLTVNQISPRLLGGPIEIAKQAGKSAEEGFSRFLLFLTMLSANLAVVNFLPIPVLDGGHMVFLVYEWLRGKPPSEGVVAALSYLGLALILTLMMFVFGLDLGLIPRR
jgi:regulator of sigma E protease